MEQSFREGDEENVLASQSGKLCDVVDKSAVLSPAPRKPGVLGNHNLDLKFASQTPEKLNNPSAIELEEGELEVPERFAHIFALFEGLIFSLRLLRLRKKSATFQNVSAQVNVLTGRMLSYCELAQMKFILPEAIQTEKILVHDKKTLCMKPEMKISLQFGDIESHQGKSDFAAMCRAFASRLVHYFVEHPEAVDLPEAILPDPFNRDKYTVVCKETGDIREAAYAETPGFQVELETTSVQHEPSLKSSYLSPSFTRHFSRKVLAPEDEKTEPLRPSPSLPPEASHDTTDIVAARKDNGQSPGRSSQSNSLTNLEVKVALQKESPETRPKIEVKPLNYQATFASSTVESSLSKLHSAADGFMVETPAQSTPRRAMPSSDVKDDDVASQRPTSVKRSLDFFRCSEGDACTADSFANMLGSSVQFQQNIQRVNVEDHWTGQNLKHQQIPDQLRKLVSLIHSIFRSVNYFPITKEELAYKILINSFDFEERSDVDEHIKILEKLVPDWIFNKLTPSGDDLYNINKMMDLESVYARITSV